MFKPEFQNEYTRGKNNGKLSTENYFLEKENCNHLIICDTLCNLYNVLVEVTAQKVPYMFKVFQPFSSLIIAKILHKLGAVINRQTAFLIRNDTL